MTAERTIELAVAAVKAFDGRGIKVETDWLDDETFVINFSGGDFDSRETALEYALPLLRSLGETAAEVLNKERRKPGHEWICHSEEEYWGADGELTSHGGEWNSVQVCVYLETADESDLETALANRIHKMIMDADAEKFTDGECLDAVLVYLENNYKIERKGETK